MREQEYVDQLAIATMCKAGDIGYTHLSALSRGRYYSREQGASATGKSSLKSLEANARNMGAAIFCHEENHWDCRRAHACPELKKGGVAVRVWGASSFKLLGASPITGICAGARDGADWDSDAVFSIDRKSEPFFDKVEKYQDGTVLPATFGLEVRTCNGDTPVKVIGDIGDGWPEQKFGREGGTIERRNKCVALAMAELFLREVKCRCGQGARRDREDMLKSSTRVEILLGTSSGRK